MRISPSNGKLQTSFLLEGTDLGTFSTEAELGQKVDIAFEIPLISVYVKPVINTIPNIVGPGFASPQNIDFTNMKTKSIRVNVNDEIGNSNSIELQMPLTLFLEVGAEIKIPFIFSETFPVESFQISDFSTISKSIPLEKILNTKLDLEVNNNSRSEHIKVKPMLISDKGTLYDYSVKIYVDDKFKQTVQSSRWSEDVWVGYGAHSVKAEFTQSNDKSNSAIIYLDSVDFESISLKTPTSQSTTDSKNLRCGSGTHEENGQCVADGLFGGGCLIATATYGSELAPQVQQLRELRDHKLLQTESGTLFMNTFNDFYYSFSPIIADFERENPVFREAVNLAITPMISSLSILNHVEMETDVEVIGYGISLILLNVGMYFVAPVIVVVGIKKRI